MSQQPILVEIDLSLTTRQGGAGLEAGPTYLVLHDGKFHTGKFGKVWYGLYFQGPTGAQYEPPGMNYSSWQRIWRIDNAAAISNDAEPDYKRSRREYAIKHGMTSNGQTIDNTSALDAYGYHSTVPKMPVLRSEEDSEGN